MRIILVSLAVAVFIIGLHQTFTVGASASYFIFMIALALIFAARMVKGGEPKVEIEESKSASLKYKTNLGKPKSKK